MIETLLLLILGVCGLILFFTVTILLYLGKYMGPRRYPSTVRARRERKR